MIVKDISFEDPIDNILYDDVLLKCAEDSFTENTLRFWESSLYFIVLGKIGKAEDDVHLEKVQETKIPILRRSSGGGTVLQGPGCLNYTILLNKNSADGLSDLKQSYAYILGKVVEALDKCGVQTEYLPISDIALKESCQKISGNAQKRARNYILHHGTILYDFDLDLVERYLKMPKAMPDYREARSHLDFITNAPVQAEPFKRALADIFRSVEQKNISDQELQLLTSLRSERDIVVPFDG